MSVHDLPYPGGPGICCTPCVRSPRMPRTRHNAPVRAVARPDRGDGVSGEDDARRKAFNEALTAFRDNMHHCPDLPLEEAGALSWLASVKVKPDHQDDGTTRLVVDVSVRDFADQRGIGRDKADRLFKNLRHNGWLRRTGTRGPHYLRTPAHTLSGRVIPRGFGFAKEIRTVTPWEDIAKRPEKRKDRAPSKKREQPMSEGHGHPSSEGHGQVVRGPRTPLSEGHGQSRPRATDNECPRATDTSSEGHGQTPAVSPYKPSHVLEPQSQEPVAHGGTLPSVATAGGHPVPRPPARYPEAADEIPTEATTPAEEHQPQEGEIPAQTSGDREATRPGPAQPPRLSTRDDVLFGTRRSA